MKTTHPLSKENFAHHTGSTDGLPRFSLNYCISEKEFARKQKEESFASYNYLI
jgi:hypothetical protein